MCSLEHSWRAAGCLCLDNDLYVFSCEHTFPISCCCFSRLDKKILVHARCFPKLVWCFFPPSVPFCFPLNLFPSPFPFSLPLQPLTHHWSSPFYIEPSALLCAIWWFSFQQLSKNIWNLILPCKTLPAATQTQPFASSLPVPLSQAWAQTPPDQTRGSAQTPGSDKAEQDVLINSTFTLKGFCPLHTHPCHCSEHHAEPQSDSQDLNLQSFVLSSS